MTTLLASLLALSLILGIKGYPDGAPEIACADMTPGHAVPPQNTTSPYKVEVSSQKVQPQATLTVFISAEAGDNFRGFFLQMREVGSSSPIGTFEASNTVKVITCPGGAKNAATHKINNLKTNVTVTWVAPSSPPTGDVELTLTVVRSSRIFWIGQTLPLKIKVVHEDYID